MIMMAQLNQIDKTVATDIKIRGNFDADVTISEMAALMSVIKSFNQIGTLELSAYRRLPISMVMPLKT